MSVSKELFADYNCLTSAEGLLSAKMENVKRTVCLYCFVGIFMVRMDWFDKCNPNRYLYNSRGGQNYQLLLPITYKGKCGYLDEVVYRYRIRDNSHFHSVTETNKKLERCDIHQKIILETFKLIKFDSFREKFSYIRRIKKKYRDRKKEIKMYS